MRSIKKLGVPVAVLLCAILLVIPLASADGPGQGADHGSGPGTLKELTTQNPGQSQGGMMPMNPNQNQGSSGSQQASPGGSNDNSNSQPPAMNSPQPMNETGNGPGNMPAGNMTFSPPPFDANSTVDLTGPAPMSLPGGINGTWNNTAIQPPIIGNMTGNMTPPQQQGSPGMNTQSHDNSGSQSQGNGVAPTQNQDQKDSSLISAFLTWLHGS